MLLKKATTRIIVSFKLTVMRATFQGSLSSEQPDQRIALFHVAIAENEIGIPQRWPELQHWKIKLAVSSGPFLHSTHVAVVATSTTRFLVPVMKTIGGRNAVPLLDHILHKDNGETEISDFFAAVGIDLDRGR